MLKLAIANHLEKLRLELEYDDDLIVQQLLIDAALIACRLQEEAELKATSEGYCNDN